MAVDWQAYLTSASTAARRARNNTSQIEFRNPRTGATVWRSNVGPQSDVMWRPELEILLGGSRGGGKSDALMVWMIKGNFDLPEDHPCFSTLLNHSKYTGLILRRNSEDLREFLDRATPFYRALGAERFDDPPVFVWGKKQSADAPRIYTNHLNNSDAFEKYRGASIPRIGIEELTQITDRGSYLKMISVTRTVFPELRPAWSDALGQILSTTNPDGPGAGWVKDRFVEVIGMDGKINPWGRPIVEWVDELPATRVFMPARLKDNPYLGESYKAGLLLQAADDPSLVAAWLDGVWGQGADQYFPNFRPAGPRRDEPPEANHVIPRDAVSLMPWWPRYIGCDWGFGHEAAVYWSCYNQADERTHIYRELVVNGQTGKQFGTEELGAEIAKLSIRDLEGQNDHVIPLFLSHECFNVEDKGKTAAQQIAWGIEAQLGAGSVAIASQGADLEMIERVARMEGKARIVVVRSTRDRVNAWQYMRQLLRFKPTQPIGEPDMAYARQLLDQPGGFDKYAKYMETFKPRKQQPLPQLLIWDNCPLLIKQMKDAVRDPKDPEDVFEDGKKWSNDRLDAARYLLWGMKTHTEAMPKWAFMQDRVSSLPSHITSDPTIYAQVMRKAEYDWQDQNAGGDGVMRLPRLSVQ